jgi:hypothetical protein
MHRSGLSMVVRLLYECGVYLGNAIDLVPPSPANRERYWDNRHFVDINDRLLATLGGSWDFPPKIGGEWRDIPELATCRDDANRLIQQFDPYPPWAWKDPRNSLTVRFWASMVPDLQVVVCLRHPLDVAESLRRWSYSTLEFGLNLWLEYNQRVLADTPSAKRVITHYDSYFVQPQEELQRVLAKLEISASRSTLDRACEAVARRLRHNRQSPIALGPNILPPSVKELYTQMCEEAGVAEAGKSEARSTHPILVVNKPPEPNNFATNVNSAESSDSAADEMWLHNVPGNTANLIVQVNDLTRQRDSLREALVAAEEIRKELEQDQTQLRELLEAVDLHGLRRRQLLDKLRWLSTRLLTGQVRPIERILVVKTSSDFYCSAALDQLTTIFPDARLTLWTEERESEDFYSHEGIERIVLYRNIGSVPQMLRDLRSVRADLIVTQTTYESTYAKMLVLAGILLPGPWLVYDEHANITAAGGLAVKVETAVGSFLAGGRWVNGTIIGVSRAIKFSTQIIAAPVVTVGLLIGAAGHTYRRVRYLRRVGRYADTSSTGG